MGEYLSAPDGRRHLWHACFASGHPSFRWQTAAAATRLYDRLTYAPGKELASEAYGDCPPGLLRCLGRLGAEPRSGYTYRALVQVLLYTSRYLAALSAVIMAHNGTVDKFVGDAIMAIWNAPADDPDHVTNACSAALACRRANEELNAAFEREGWPAYRTRFGLHTGDAVVGNIGSDDRMNYTVLGATVNMAARLEPLNKEHGTAILVSETVARRAAEGFDFRFVTEVNLKGFGNKVRVYELLAKER